MRSTVLSSLSILPRPILIPHNVPSTQGTVTSDEWPQQIDKHGLLYRGHRGIIALFGSWGLQATKLWNLWNLSHFTHTSLPTEGTSSVAGAYRGLAIAESFRIVSTLKRQKAVLCLNKFCLGICKSTSMFSRNVQATLVPSKRARYH